MLPVTEEDAEGTGRLLGAAGRRGPASLRLKDNKAPSPACWWLSILKEMGLNFSASVSLFTSTRF